MLHLWLIPVYILAYFTGARSMFWLLTRMDQPQLMHIVHDHYSPSREVVDLDKSRNARVAMSFLWVPLIIVVTILVTALGVYTYVTKPMVTPAEHAERKRRKSAELDRAVKQAEHELSQTDVTRTDGHNYPDQVAVATRAVYEDGHIIGMERMLVTNPTNPDQVCQCQFCNGRSGVHGDEAIALHNARAAAHIDREGYH